MTSEQSLHVCEIRGLASSIGSRIEQCRREGQLSCAVHLNTAREELYKAIRSYNPATDERQLELTQEYSEQR